MEIKSYIRNKIENIKLFFKKKDSSDKKKALKEIKLIKQEINKRLQNIK